MAGIKDLLTGSLLLSCVAVLCDVVLDSSMVVGILVVGSRGREMRK